MLTANISCYGLEFSISELKNKIGENAYNILLKTYTTIIKPHPKFKNKYYNKSIKAYKLDKNTKIIIPRIKIRALNNIVDNDGKKIIDKISYDNNIIKPSRTLDESKFLSNEIFYEYQVNAINRLSKYELADHNYGIAYLQLDTGLGKTRVGCGLIRKLKVPTMIVAPTAAIAQQWVDELTKTYPSLETIIYHNKSKCVINSDLYDVIIIIINTFRKKPVDFLRGFGFLILDEAHEYHSKCNSNALWLAQTKYVLGLSATPLERIDQADKYIIHHLGNPVKISYEQNKFKCNVKIINYCGDPKHCIAGISAKGSISAISTIGNIMNDKSRAEMIVMEILELYNLHKSTDIEKLKKLGLGDGRRHGIMVFCEHREYLNIINECLKQHISSTEIYSPELNDNTDPVKVSILKGGISESHLSETKKSGAHIVLTTYGYSRRGLSLVDMTALILATPRRYGLNQIIGRIMRKGSDESIIRQIIDIVDVRISLKNQIVDRVKVYEERKYPIIYKNYLFSDIKTKDNKEVKEVKEVNIDKTNDDLDDLISSLYKINCQI
jgi:superfamily II DNA or RNA helicase